MKRGLESADFSRKNIVKNPHFNPVLVYYTEIIAYFILSEENNFYRIRGVCCKLGSVKK